MRRAEFEEMLATQDAHWWFKGKRRIVDKIIRTNVVSNAPLDILEVGSGTGANLPALSRYGHVVALELDDYARNSIAPMENVTVAKGYLPDGLEAVQNKTFDLICLFDVLEHIEHDDEALGALKGRLRPGGKILLTVPAYQWMYSVHDKLLGHYRRYTKAGLRKLCEGQGLDILYAGYINALLFPLMAAARFVDRIRGRKEHSTGSGVPPFGLNSLFNAIFYLESLWVPHISFPFGGSVLMLCSLKGDPDGEK